MGRFTLKSFQGTIRPFITATFALAQIVLAFVWAFGAGAGEMPEKAFQALAPTTVAVVMFWFKDREEGSAG